MVTFKMGSVHVVEQDGFTHRVPSLLHSSLMQEYFINRGSYTVAKLLILIAKNTAIMSETNY